MMRADSNGADWSNSPGRDLSARAGVLRLQALAITNKHNVCARLRSSIQALRHETLAFSFLPITRKALLVLRYAYTPSPQGNWGFFDMEFAENGTEVAARCEGFFYDGRGVRAGVRWYVMVLSGLLGCRCV